MNSSTSNSKSEIRVVIAVLSVLFCCEILVRIEEPKLSLDVRHIHEIPAIVQRLSTKQSERILFLGNSLTRAGVEPATIQLGLTPPSGKSLAVERVYPDDTTLSDWYYIYRTFIVDKHAEPDVVVVSFALDQLEDHSQMHVDRLGGYFGGWATRREVFAYDLPGFGDRVEYELASSSRLFANQDRIRLRVLDFLVPHYRQSAGRLNRIVQQTAQKKNGSQQSYARLRRFIELVRGNGSKLFLVAMPTGGPEYQIPQSLVDTARSEDAIFLDMRGINGVDYSDGYHLTAQGAKKYSAALAQSLQRAGVFNSDAVAEPALRAGRLGQNESETHSSEALVSMCLRSK
jgi:hypothetical protein